VVVDKGLRRAVRRPQQFPSCLNGGNCPLWPPSHVAVPPPHKDLDAPWVLPWWTESIVGTRVGNCAALYRPQRNCIGRRVEVPTERIPPLAQIMPFRERLTPSVTVSFACVKHAGTLIWAGRLEDPAGCATAPTRAGQPSGRGTSSSAAVFVCFPLRSPKSRLLAKRDSGRAICGGTRQGIKAAPDALSPTHPPKRT
jgi:hypothetical protein